MIVLTDNLALSSDANQWMLLKPRKIDKDHPSGWQPFKYYTTLVAAVRGGQSYLLRTSTYDTAEELLSNHRALTAVLDAKLKEVLI